MNQFWQTQKVSGTLRYYLLKYIFLAYINRSGSTFLANLFSRSPDIMVCPEAEILIDIFLANPGAKFKFSERFVETIGKYTWEDEKLKFWEINEDVIFKLKNCKTNFEAFASILLNYRDKHKPLAHTIVFKAEKIINYFDRLGNIDHLNSKLYFISLIRDCRAVYASQKNIFFPGTSKKMSNNPVKTGLLWNRFYSQTSGLSENTKVLVVHYENLISNTNQVFGRIISELKISSFDYLSGNGDFFERLPDHHKLIHKNIDKNPILERLSAWKQQLSDEEIYIIQKVSRKYLLLAGYGQIEVAINRMVANFKIIYFYILYLLKRFSKVISFHLFYVNRIRF